jgi:hypothetical protein
MVHLFHESNARILCVDKVTSVFPGLCYIDSMDKNLIRLSSLIISQLALTAKDKFFMIIISSSSSHAVALIVNVLCYKPDGRGFESQWGHCIFTIYLIPLAAPLPWRFCTRRSFLGVKCGLRIRLTTKPPSISRLVRQCGILNLSHPYGPPRPVIVVALLYCQLVTGQSSSFSYWMDSSGTQEGEARGLVWDSRPRGLSACVVNCWVWEIELDCRL